MADNETTGAGKPVATDKVTYSGDADQNVQLVKVVQTTGAEGSKTVVDPAHDDPDAGNPIKVGGKASSANPADVAAGDRVNAWFTLNGRQAISIRDGAGNEPSTLNWSSDGVAPGNITGIAMSVTPYLSDGASGADRQRANIDVSLLASASRTTTQTGSDQINYNARGIVVVLDMTVVGTGSVTLTIQGKDVVSGKYYTLLAGVAVTTNSTNVYYVFPGATVTANVSANAILPRTWRTVVTANNANAATYSLGASVIL